ncbi:phytanoyl-CoA dioxygenase family protein [Mycolicibacterium arenosum]|uniref:Mitomycin antibiotics/polyketide fumonisin biosynthesis protein n=1 Tax=Mycolicibacterium arenosum TaxID=2952157 RepID=A0ABT1M1F3_9MYCO|nr:mitomycin antibiotics/polyketide fumonisin biosynthesis protein [Mycolicibacterium sp. CAU 1645]MCP9272632.1 mitomycin antibiotics/polyketide fumonisin biosynthesis protein [Mycolicibacterium sp. CAU 1645]
MVDIDAFTASGFLKVEGAVPREVADAARALLWEQLEWSPDEPDEWTEPVRWVADLTGAGPFGELARSRAVATALDAVCGAGGWLPRGALGNIPVRFPVSPPADDRGWHVDANTPLPDGSWAVTGRPHTLLLLTLLSDVGPDDAPTRIRSGSHHRVAAALTEAPVDFVAAASVVAEASEGCPVVRATGGPGDVYVVHPFTVHAADVHRGREPRFMAQGPVPLTSPLSPSTGTPLGCVFTA